MKIDKYLVELLFDHECVIVPGLGGFIINERHATIDRVTRQFNPPFKKILFNQHIRFNDGLLVNYIANKEKLSFETVRKQIDELVQQFFTNLENGEKIQFENIGILAFDKNKNISFDQDSAVNFNAESFGFGSFVSPPIKRKVEIEAVQGIMQPQPPATKREDRKPERPVADELKPIHKRRNKSASTSLRSFLTVLVALIFLISGVVVYFNSDSVRNSVNNLASSVTLKKEKSRYTPRSGQDNVSKIEVENQAGFLTGTTFELETPVSEQVSENNYEEIQVENNSIAGEISVADYFNYRGRNLVEKFSEPENEQEIIENEIVEPVTEAETTPPIAKEEIVVTTKPSSQYYIIAGSFSEESNAMSLIDELLKKGFSAQIIDTNKNGMYRVAYVGVENFTDAKEKLYAIRKEDNPDAWILKK